MSIVHFNTFSLFSLGPEDFVGFRGLDLDEASVNGGFTCFLDRNARCGAYLSGRRTWSGAVLRGFPQPRWPFRGLQCHLRPSATNYIPFYYTPWHYYKLFFFSTIITTTDHSLYFYIIWMHITNIRNISLRSQPSVNYIGYNFSVLINNSPNQFKPRVMCNSIHYYFQ